MNKSQVLELLEKAAYSFEELSKEIIDGANCMLKIKNEYKLVELDTDTLDAYVNDVSKIRDQKQAGHDIKNVANLFYRYATNISNGETTQLKITYLYDAIYSWVQNRDYQSEVIGLLDSFLPDETIMIYEYDESQARLLATQLEETF